MLDRLLKLEEQLARLEALLLVVFVLLMLGLATYNVFYRNVLVPIQVSMLTDPNAVEVTSESMGDTPDPAADVAGEPVEDEAGGFGGGFGDDDSAGGFGGGFGDTAPEADGSAGFGGDFGDVDAPADAKPTKPREAAADEAAGFGGDFGDTAAAEVAKADPADSAAGFGGDFGGDDAAPAEADDSAGFGGDFAGGDDSGFGGDFEGVSQEVPSDTASASDDAPAVPKEEPAFSRFVDAVKLEWIDVLLRQLVLVVGFLGAMLATRRRKHITVDALSKVMPEKALLWVNVFTNVLSLFVCVVLAKAGSELVNISIEYPKELMSWADEWHFQMAFPVGFGMLALHFAIRVIEAVAYASGKVDPPDDFEVTGGAI